MGWSGYNTYDGDGTQTMHYDYLVWAKVCKPADKDNGVIEEMLTIKGTILNKDQQEILSKNWRIVCNKIDGKCKYFTEDSALNLQMLVALFVDNKMEIPHGLFNSLADAIDYLCGDHASEFNEPSKRRACLRRFLAKAAKLSP